jgi:ethanolamine ammonia-lyase small subunit
LHLCRCSRALFKTLSVGKHSARETVQVAPSWVALRRHTPARIALGRAGFGVPTGAYLEFQAAHARARDAVHAHFDLDAMLQAIAMRGWHAIGVASAASDRQAFLRMPHLGRTLAAESRARLSQPLVAPDVAIIIGDGLSSVAVERHAAPVFELLCARLIGMELRFVPIVVAKEARVALADDIGELLQAKVAVMMLGERPGLSAADSLGMYLTFAPRRGRLDSERNCISNIHGLGMSARHAATRAVDLISKMLTHQASGVLLATRMQACPKTA